MGVDKGQGWESIEYEDEEMTDPWGMRTFEYCLKWCIDKGGREKSCALGHPILIKKIIIIINFLACPRLLRLSVFIEASLPWFAAVGPQIQISFFFIIPKEKCVQCSLLSGAETLGAVVRIVYSLQILFTCFLLYNTILVRRGAAYNFFASLLDLE